MESFPKPDFPDMMSKMEMSDMADFELDFEPNKFQSKVPIGYDMISMVVMMNMMSSLEIIINFLVVIIVITPLVIRSQQSSSRRQSTWRKKGGEIRTGGSR